MTQEETLFDRELLRGWIDYQELSVMKAAAMLDIDNSTLGHYLVPYGSRLRNPSMSCIASIARHLPWKQPKPVWTLRDEDYRLLALLRGTACNRAMHAILEAAMKQKGML